MIQYVVCCVLCAILLQSQRACCKTYVVYMIHTWLTCSLYTQKADTRHTICQWIQSFKLIHLSTSSYMHKEAYMSSVIHHVYMIFVQHIISSFDILWHADYSTYSYIIIQHSCRHVFDFIRHYVYICRICFPWNMKLKHTCIDIIWHHLTSFDTIW